MSLKEALPSLQNSALLDDDAIRTTAKPTVTCEGDSNGLLQDSVVSDGTHLEKSPAPESGIHQQVTGEISCEPSGMTDAGTSKQDQRSDLEDNQTISDEYNQHTCIPNACTVADSLQKTSARSSEQTEVPPSEKECLSNSNQHHTIPSVYIGHISDTTSEHEHQNSSNQYYTVPIDTEDPKTGPENVPSTEQCQITSSEPNNLYDPNDPELRPPTTTWQQVTIGMIGFGMEVCYATETALLVPILLQLGLPDRFYSVIWFVSPVLGFLLQPIIGSCSDRCTSPWGRRRPFVLAMGLGMVVGVSIFLNGEDIGLQLGDTVADHSIGIIITMIGQVILDWNADSADTPARSYTLDVFNPLDLEKSLTYRALLGGLGGGIGYIINGIDWEKNALGEALGSQIRVVYLFCSIFCLLSIFLTVCSVKETPLTKKQANHKPTTQSIQNHNKYDAIQPTQYGTFSDPKGQSSNDERSLLVEQRSQRSSFSSYNEDTDLEWDNSFDFHHFDLTDPTQQSYHGHIRFDTNDDRDVVPLATRRTKGFLAKRRMSTASLQLEERDHPGSALQLLYSIVQMPRELRRLCFNHYLAWTAMVTILLFFTDYVGQVVYRGDPKAPLGSPERTLYQQGVHMGCWGMCIFAFSAALSAVLYGRLMQFLSYRTIYVWTQVLFAVGTGCQAIFYDYEWVTLALCTTFGLMFTSIQSIPFSILSDFHKTEQYVKSPSGYRRGLGTDVSCLSAMVFLAQITVSSILGPLMNAIGSHLVIVLFASIMAFMSSIVAAVFVIYEIKEDDEEEEDIGVKGYAGLGESGSSKYSESDDDEQRPLLIN
ncbi:membrane-associated transporter protein-like [Amphiura filiformis]|uniref:membrane-associated transporter protein-like n=1 Tax=Amphiura filiformis TaxID=82378 RepID=UPI003B228D63